MSFGDDKLAWHDRQWQRLAEARDRGRLPHAILLAGAAGLGKSLFASRLAHALVCPTPDAHGDACGACQACRLSAAGSHPDLHWLEPEEEGKAIKIDAVRQLTAKSVLAAQKDGFRVVVINPADAMNRPAANALLKTLEEPSSRTVLVLVTSQSDRLPATIRSRCQTVAFPIPKPSDARVWLSGQVADGDIDALLALTGGAPLRALQANEQAWQDADAQLIRELSDLRARKGNPLQVVEEWRNRPITQVFDSFKRCLADLVRLQSTPESDRVYHPAEREQLQRLGQDIDLRLLYAFNDEVLHMNRDATNNLNPQMMLEYLANHWLRMTRPGGR